MRKRNHGEAPPPHAIDGLARLDVVSWLDHAARRLEAGDHPAAVEAVRQAQGLLDVLSLSTRIVDAVLDVLTDGNGCIAWVVCEVLEERAHELAAAVTGELRL